MIDLKDPRALRESDLNLMRAYSEVSKRFADTGMNEQALACQARSDAFRISAQLWHRAESESDPHGAYFRYLTSAYSSAVTSSDNPGTSAYDAFLLVRESYRAATRALNIPLALPPVGHLRAIGRLDVSTAGAALTDGLSAEEYFTQRILPADSRNAAANAQVAILTYLVDLAERTGDTARMSALAAWSLLRQKGIEAHRLEEVLTVAEQYLGPVDWVRLGPYLERSGVRKA